MPAKVYTNKDADLRVLKNKQLAVIGYGSQGHAHAQNLRDSGLRVLIGLYRGSKSIQVAKRHGFEVEPTAEAVKRADVIMMGVPDMKQKAVFENDVLPHLSKGKTLLFTHGFSIHFGLIEKPRGIDVIMVAPKGIGQTVRTQFLEGKGVPSLIAVLKGSSRNAKRVALAWAKGIGATRAGVIQTTFREETETDLFGEQAVLCGGLSALVFAGYETLVEAGYQPEMAYYECLHELKLIIDIMVESGVAGMRFTVSETATYGDITRGPRVISESAREAMKKILADVQSGTFAREWVKEYEEGLPAYKALLEEGDRHQIERVGRRLRARMPWVKRTNIKGAQAAY